MVIDVQQSVIVYISLNCIVDKLHVRRLNAMAVKRFQESMQRLGYFDNYPLIVAPLGDGTYKVVDGNHRRVSAEKAGITHVPCIVKNELPDSELYKLAFQSNSASESAEPTTMVHYAEFVWARKEQYTLAKIAEMMGWSEAKVKQYSALDAIKSEAWNVIVTSFENIGNSSEKEEVTQEVTSVTFTEKLLRTILDLTPEQQLELVTELTANKDFSKSKFKILAENYHARNQMKDYAVGRLGDLGELYTVLLIDAVYSGAYDADWKQIDHPKLHRLIQSLCDEWEQKNSVHLVHGDFYEEVKKVGDGSVDLVLTDPPYNVASEREFAMEGRSNISQDFGEWDKHEHQQFIDLFGIWAYEWSRILRDGGSGYVFTSDIYLSHLREALEQAGITVKTTIVWHRKNPPPQFEQTTFQSSVEYILFFVKGQGYTFHWLSNSDGTMHNFIDSAICGGNERVKDAKGNNLHPTQKPVQVLKHLMQVSSNRGDMVFDGFAGVGSVGKAAKELGCKFIGIEQDKTFFDAMQRRLAND